MLIHEELLRKKIRKQIITEAYSVSTNNVTIPSDSDDPYDTFRAIEEGVIKHNTAVLRATQSITSGDFFTSVDDDSIPNTSKENIQNCTKLFASILITLFFKSKNNNLEGLYFEVYKELPTILNWKRTQHPDSTLIGDEEFETDEAGDVLDTNQHEHRNMKKIRAIWAAAVYNTLNNIANVGELPSFTLGGGSNSETDEYKDTSDLWSPVSTSNAILSTILEPTDLNLNNIKSKMPIPNLKKLKQYYASINRIIEYGAPNSLNIQVGGSKGPFIFAPGYFPSVSRKISTKDVVFDIRCVIVGLIAKNSESDTSFKEKGFKNSIDALADAAVDGIKQTIRSKDPIDAIIEAGREISIDEAQRGDRGKSIQKNFFDVSPTTVSVNGLPLFWNHYWHQSGARIKTSISWRGGRARGGAGVRGEIDADIGISIRLCPVILNKNPESTLLGAIKSEADFVSGEISTHGKNALFHPDDIIRGMTLCLVAKVFKKLGDTSTGEIEYGGKTRKIQLKDTADMNTTIATMADDLLKEYKNILGSSNPQRVRKGKNRDKAVSSEFSTVALNHANIISNSSPEDISQFQSLADLAIPELDESAGIGTKIMDTVVGAMNWARSGAGVRKSGFEFVQDSDRPYINYKNIVNIVSIIAKVRTGRILPSVFFDSLKEANAITIDKKFERAFIFSYEAIMSTGKEKGARGLSKPRYGTKIEEKKNFYKGVITEGKKVDDPLVNGNKFTIYANFTEYASKKKDASRYLSYRKMAIIAKVNNSNAGDFNLEKPGGKNTNKPASGEFKGTKDTADYNKYEAMVNHYEKAIAPKKKKQGTKISITNRSGSQKTSASTGEKTIEFEEHSIYPERRKKSLWKKICVIGTKYPGSIKLRKIEDASEFDDTTWAPVHYYGGPNRSYISYAICIRAPKGKDLLGKVLFARNIVPPSLNLENAGDFNEETDLKVDTVDAVFSALANASGGKFESSDEINNNIFNMGMAIDFFNEFGSNLSNDNINKLKDSFGTVWKNAFIDNMIEIESPVFEPSYDLSRNKRRQLKQIIGRSFSQARLGKNMSYDIESTWRGYNIKGSSMSSSVKNELLRGIDLFQQSVAKDIGGKTSGKTNAGKSYSTYISNYRTYYNKAVNRFFASSGKSAGIKADEIRGNVQISRQADYSDMSDDSSKPFYPHEEWVKLLKRTNNKSKFKNMNLSNINYAGIPHMNCKYYFKKKGFPIVPLLNKDQFIDVVESTGLNKRFKGGKLQSVTIKFQSVNYDSLIKSITALTQVGDDADAVLKEQKIRKIIRKLILKEDESGIPKDSIPQSEDAPPKFVTPGSDSFKQDDPRKIRAGKSQKKTFQSLV